MGRPRNGKVHRRSQPSSVGKASDNPVGDFEDDIDLFHRERDKIPLSLEDSDNEDDDEHDDPVFNLEDSDDDDLDEEEMTDLTAKIAREEKRMRQKSTDFDEEDNESEEDDKRKSVWGKGKKIYYNADNVDFELQSSDEEAPAEEELEVRRLQQEMAASLRPEDFEQDEDDDDVQEESDRGEVTLENLAKRHLEKDGANKLIPLKEARKDEPDTATIMVEKVTKDYNLLSKEEQMQLVMSDSPELVGLLEELREAVDELKNKVQPLIEKVRGGHCATKDGISYLEAKHLLLLSYCQSIVFYLLLKADGRSARDHPVIRRLVEIRMLIEKIRPIDKKLHYQIEKLLNSASAPSTNDEKAGNAATEQEDALKYRPNPNMLVSKLEESAQESGGIYRPPMIAPVAMQDDGLLKDRKLRARAEKDLQRRASRSAFVKDLANELEGRPEEVDEFIGLESKEMLRERARLEERASKEEELFARVPLSKAERQKLKHLGRSRNGLFGMLDDFDDDIADVADMENEKQKAPLGPPSDLLKPRKLSQLINEASQRSKRPKVDSGDVDLPLREDIGERRRKHDVRRPFATNASDEEAEAEIDFKPVEDDFYQQIKERKASKQAGKAEKYSRHPVIPIPAEVADADGKRHISYQMEKNKGLTPHRKKQTKNPRKKYKVKHEKALVRRKGQVREIRRPEGPYGGESTGIRTNLSRSIRFKG